MRPAAYFVLAFFCSLLEGAHFREKSQLLYLLDIVQNGIRQPKLRFTFSLTLYIARMAQQMLKPALKWLQNRVLPHLAAVREMLGDETLRNNLFKLYNWLCQANSTSVGLSRELGVLGSIMLQLMEEQGLSSTFHELVNSLCLLATMEEDVDKRGDLSCP
ncbi:hypothetical protein TURU_060646 [Turdus rufiventris]|nr:hypothetical protein TURU_060646 [Turdus rufiventris]